MRRSTLAFCAALGIYAGAAAPASAQEMFLSQCGEEKNLTKLVKDALFAIPRQCMPRLADLYCRAKLGEDTTDRHRRARAEGCLDAHSRIVRGTDSLALQYIVAEEKFASKQDRVPDPILDTVLSQRLPNIRYVAIKNFMTETTYAKVARAFEGLGSTDRIIIDLRSNPGGIPNEGMRVAGLFAPQRGMTLAVIRYGTNTASYVTKERGPLAGRPVVILVDRFTASTSEVFVGAMLYMQPRLVTVMGLQTFGKASQQTLHFYEERRVEVAITTAEITVGPGLDRRIDGFGVMPTVPLTRDFMGEGKYDPFDPTVMHAFKFVGFFRAK